MRLMLIVLSWVPFSVLHVASRGIYFLLYYGIGYRRKVVRENLKNSFPEKTDAWRLDIERKFYRNFCDLIIEAIKTTTISKETFLSRCTFTSFENSRQWYASGKSVNGIASHLANWEWLPLSASLSMEHRAFGVYKPLSNAKMNEFMVNSRERFGTKLLPIAKLRSLFEMKHERPLVLGLLSDQAPHDYSRAFEVHFLNQKTYVVPGPGILSVKHNLVPAWGWMRRVGRSRYEWGLDPVLPDASQVLTDSEHAQVERIAKAYELTRDESERSYRIVKEYSRLLEAQIRKAPEDWLWSHRRWKAR